jgi:two-component system, OmpR family, response regulator
VSVPALRATSRRVPTETAAIATATTMNTASSMPGTDGIRVLVVEDSQAILTSLVELIEEDPRCRVAFSTDSEREARDAFARESFDIAIVDLQIREGTGQGVLRYLKTLPHPPLRIVLTNFDRPAVREQCRVLGAEHFFDKSREFESVVGAISDWIEARASRN